MKQKGHGVDAQRDLASPLGDFVDVSLLVVACGLSGYSHLQIASRLKPTGNVQNLQRRKMEAEDGSAREGTWAEQQQIQEKSNVMH